MKLTTAILSILLVISSASMAQATKGSVEKRFLEYSDLIGSGNFQGALDYTIDELFTIAPRENVLAMMERMLHSAGMDTRIDRPEIRNIYEPFRESGAYYCIVEYISNTRIRSTKTGSDTTRTENPKVTENMKKTFGEDGVRYESQSGYYLISVHKRVIAKAADGVNWKFMVAEERQQALLEKILPAPIINKLFGVKITPGH